MIDLLTTIKKYMITLSVPKMTLIDVLEIFVIAFVIYHVFFWIKRTRAWSLVKGILVLFLAYILVYLFDMHVLLWIFNKTIAIGITALIIVFQPEFRKALDELGQKRILGDIFATTEGKDKEYKLSDRSINEIVRATIEMGKVKTGALIVLERDVLLSEYERTGINIDSSISSQLIINIFEHNTPLHDGAVIVREDRILTATCYLPLSDNLGLSKDLGTRHRAAVGISEVSDSLTIIVSEETGNISVAIGGKLMRNLDGDILRQQLVEAMQGNSSEPKPKRRFWRKKGGK